MSNKRNCLENAIIENFFGILKSELFYLKKYKSVNELKKIVTKSDMRPTILERKTNIKNAVNSYFPIEK